MSAGNVIQIKRAYDPPAKSDGHRVLVDRVWPRGRKKEELRSEAWLKELAPSSELRRWFGHDPARWTEFQKRYRRELRRKRQRELLHELAERAAKSRVTLVYGARDDQHNNAVVLREVIEEMAGGGAE